MLFRMTAENHAIRFYVSDMSTLQFRKGLEHQRNILLSVISCLHRKLTVSSDKEMAQSERNLHSKI